MGMLADEQVNQSVRGEGEVKILRKNNKKVNFHKIFYFTLHHPICTATVPKDNSGEHYLMGVKNYGNLNNRFFVCLVLLRF